MRFEWDKANLLKHGIDFTDSTTAFSDEHALTLADPDATGERRFVTMAMDATGRILVTA